MTRLPLLFNPGSGTRLKDPDALLRAVPGELAQRIEPVPWGPPWDFGPVVAQARQAGGPLLVWGGDGTIHHAACYLLGQGCPVPLGALPGGSGNGLVGGLRTPLRPASALIRLMEGRVLAMDAAFLEDRPFFNLAGTGFEAEVAWAFDAAGSRGLKTYAQHSLRLWRSHRALKLVWEADVPEPEPVSKALERWRAAWRGPALPLPAEAWSLCLANLPQYGNGLWIAPEADPVDGCLSWVALRRPSLLDALRHGPALFRERSSSGLRTMGQVGGGTLRLDREAPWHVDGEPWARRDRVDWRILPRVFQMQVTGDCPWL